MGDVAGLVLTTGIQDNNLKTGSCECNILGGNTVLEITIAKEKTMDPNSIEDKKKAAYYMRNNPVPSSSGDSDSFWVIAGKAIAFLFGCLVLASVLSGK
jgi:hypothetical protein